MLKLELISLINESVNISLSQASNPVFMLSGYHHTRVMKITYTITYDCDISLECLS